MTLRIASHTVQSEADKPAEGFRRKIYYLRWRKAQYGNSPLGIATAFPAYNWERPSRLPGPFSRAVVHVFELHRRTQPWLIKLLNHRPMRIGGFVRADRDVIEV